jgi:hypothetical protein
LCFVTDVPLAEFINHPNASSLPLKSVYFRDPDANPIEVCVREQFGVI